MFLTDTRLPEVDFKSKDTLASRRIKAGKSTLPVEVHRSKTFLLKLSIA